MPLTVQKRKELARKMAESMFVLEERTADMDASDLYLAMVAADDYFDATGGDLWGRLPQIWKDNATNSHSAKLVGLVAEAKAG